MRYDKENDAFDTLIQNIEENDIDIACIQETKTTKRFQEKDME